MKKRLLAIIIALVLLTFPLVGCSNSPGKVNLSKPQDTDYVVYGNGGSAVQYGNFVYFINGYKGYSDLEAKSNVWGEVKKGALYRVELNGEKNGREFNQTYDDKTGLSYEAKPFYIDANKDEVFLTLEQFDTITSKGSIDITTVVKHKSENEDEEDTEEIVESVLYKEDLSFAAQNVERVAPKVIGTDGYKQGGIFIFDNYVYYASPNNEKNKAGTVQTDKTDFFRTSLDGKTSQKIYTTKSNTSSSPYAFYKYQNYIYLVVLDGTTLISVKLSDKKVMETLEIATSVSSAYLPVKSVYDSKNIKENTIEDFIYFVRGVNDKDEFVRKGDIIEMMRPNGKNRTIISADGKTTSIESVRDGMLFYRSQDDMSQNILLYNNLYDVISKIDNTTPVSEHLSGTALYPINSDYTSTYVFRPNWERGGNEIYVIGFTSNAIFLENSLGRIKISDKTGTLAAIYQNDLFFYDSDNNLYKINIFTKSEENEPIKIADNLSTSGLNFDIAAGYLIFRGKVDEFANEYSLFYSLEGNSEVKPRFVGERIKNDLKPEEEDEDKK